MSQAASGGTGFAMFTEYDPGLIEARWQGVWQAERTWQVSNDGGGGQHRAYVLEQLPYSSGEPHVGHLKNYTVGDAVAHYWRRTGRYVLHPMGFDAFGLPGENHAIRVGEHPRVSTDKSIAAFREQFRRWGLSIDWSREVTSHDPAYYRWTQWIFLQLHAAGLAYRAEAAVNWCPRDETVLANEQVIDGCCERCDSPVQTRQMKQWFFRITAYADRLLADLDPLDWPEHVKTMQRNWIGRSGGGASYRLRDWLLSRQRYWGCPIPVIYCDGCGAVPVPADQLPVLLPDLDDYRPRGRSPLAAAEDWMSVPCPRCGGPGRRESDTMDTFVDSSWYFLRYCDPGNAAAPWGEEAVAAWMPADCYVGGVEHAILHLLYSRFLVKALADLGHLPVREPFRRFFAQGMITRNGAKMSKSRGNSISPRYIVDRYGADAARCYVLFAGPPQHGAEWSDQGIEGVSRFLRRVWRLTAEVLAARAGTPGTGPGQHQDQHQDQDQDQDLALRRGCALAIRQVTADIDGGFGFNTAIAALMKLASDCGRAIRDGASAAAAGQALATLASLLQPFAPHLASEVYYQITGERVWTVPWPAAEESLLAAGTVEIACQVNGKLHGRLTVPAGASAAEVERAALAAGQVRDVLAGRTPARVVVVPGRLVNIVL